MDRNCDAFIRSNNTYDILIARESLEISDDRAECIQNIGEKFVAEYFDRDEVPQLSIRIFDYPKMFRTAGYACTGDNRYPAAAESASPVPSGTGYFYWIC